MGWATRIHSYAVQNGGERVPLTPRQRRRYQHKGNAQKARERRAALAALQAAHGGDDG
jgi:hypothetical protein